MAFQGVDKVHRPALLYGRQSWETTKWQWVDGATCTYKDWQSLLFARFENVIPVEANVGAECGSNARYN